MVGFFVAILSGALMSIQGVFNTEVTKTTGMWVSNAWVQLTAFAVCLAAWLIAGRDDLTTIGYESAWSGKGGTFDCSCTADCCLCD